MAKLKTFIVLLIFGILLNSHRADCEFFSFFKKIPKDLENFENLSKIMENVVDEGIQSSTGFNRIHTVLKFSADVWKTLKPKKKVNDTISEEINKFSLHYREMETKILQEITASSNRISVDVHISIDSIKVQLSNALSRISAGVNNLGKNITCQLNNVFEGVDNIQKVMSNRFHEVLQKTDTSNIKLRETLREFSNEIRLDLKLNELTVLLDYIDRKKDRLQIYLKRPNAFGRLTIDSYIEQAVGPSSDGVDAILDRIQAIVTSNTFSDVNSHGAANSLNEYLKPFEQRMECLNNKTYEDLFYTFYDLILNAELKGYIILQYSYMILNLQKRGDFENEAFLAYEAFARRVREMDILFGNLIGKPHKIWNCPDQLENGASAKWNSSLKFSWKEETSNIRLNKVITGARFVNYDNTIYIQIQEGVLQKYGFVDQSTVHWKPLAMNEEIVFNIKSRSINSITGQTRIAPTYYEVPKNAALTSLQLKSTVGGYASYDYAYLLAGYTNFNPINFQLDNDAPTPISYIHPFTQLASATFISGGEGNGKKLISLEQICSRTPTALSNIGIYEKNGHVVFNITTFDITDAASNP